jgi:hypothetical protein
MLASQDTVLWASLYIRYGLGKLRVNENGIYESR